MKKWPIEALWSIEAFLIQNKEHDDSMLHRKLSNINMRLFNNNKRYRHLILDIVNYMEEVAKREFKDYTPAKGISGANVGIPFNIIGVANKNNVWDFFLNPEYLKKSGGKKVVESNCGSLRLKEPIKVKRYKQVKLRYYNLEGQKKIGRFDNSYGYTIQHEVNHNKGILIIDEKEN